MAETSLAQEVFPFPFSEASEQIVHKSEPNAEYYFSVGDALALQGNITKALDAYSQAVSSGCVPLHRLSTFVSVLMERTRTNFQLADTPAVSTNLLNILTCRCCGSRWAEPVTLKCGHTFCRACVEHGLDDCESAVCTVCLRVIENTYLGKCKTNILLSQILEKCYPDEIAISESKVDANRLAAKKCFAEAIKVYTKVIKIAPNDLHLRNCRSWAYSIVGLHQNAIEDADLIIQLRPCWAQGYCRRATALRGLSRLEESTQCYLQCLAIDPGFSLAKTELAKVLHELLSQSSFVSNGKVPARFSLLVPPDGRSVKCAAKLNSASSEEKGLEKLSAEDFECSLCSSLLLCPVTTDCGHVFCGDCLYRSLDYRNVCPLCKESLAEFLAERRRATTEAVELITKLCFCCELEKRQTQRKQELSLWTRNAVGDQLEIPVFVCTMAYPSIPCPLHVFEPRYRLMIRRCTESGLNQFGMCICLSQAEENFAEFGTLLLIRNLQYLADGRSVLTTVGGRRFRVLSRGMLDGHHTAKVTYLSDEAIPSSEVEELLRLQMEVHSMSSHWFIHLPKSTQCRILQCYGQFPQPEPEFSHMPDGPVWVWYMTMILPVEPQIQLKILSMLSLRKRLLTIRRVLTCLHVNQSTS